MENWNCLNQLPNETKENHVIIRKKNHIKLLTETIQSWAKLSAKPVVNGSQIMAQPKVRRWRFSTVFQRSTAVRIYECAWHEIRYSHPKLLELSEPGILPPNSIPAPVSVYSWLWDNNNEILMMACAFLTTSVMFLKLWAAMRLLMFSEYNESRWQSPPRAAMKNCVLDILN